MPTINAADFPIGCTGDACIGDVVFFTEGVFEGDHRKPRLVGERRIVARILRDSYGGEKQQHTFTLEVIASDGTAPLAPGTTFRRKARNVYRNGTMRQPWPDEAGRRAALDEKHSRGDVARAVADRFKPRGW